MISRESSKRGTRRIPVVLLIVVMVFTCASVLAFGQKGVQQQKDRRLTTAGVMVVGDLKIHIRKCAQKTVQPGGKIGGLSIVARSSFPAPLREIAADLILTRRANYPVPAPLAVYSPNYSDNVLLKGGRTHVNFRRGGSVRVSFGNNNEIPADTPPGNYYLGVVIDAGNKIRENIERNNVAWCKIRVVKGGGGKLPDLIVPSVVFKNVKKGTDAKGNPYYIFNVIITVKNQGGAAAGPFKVLLERNNGPGGIYKKACITCIIPVNSGLAPGASITLPPRQFNNAMMTGPDIFRATADYGNNVTESNERNNMNATTYR